MLGLRSRSQSLWTARRFERQIELLHARHVLTPRLYELEQDGVTFASLVRHKHAFSKVLARTVASAAYVPAPARVRSILVDDKKRRVFSLRLTDLILHNVVADLVERGTARTLSPNLYSYRKGLSWWTAVNAFAQYARRHRSERPDPRQRGLYVLRRDIESYADTIPVGDRSPVWPIVRASLGDVAFTDYDWQLIVQAIRPEAVEGQGVFVQHRGVPTGLPIATVLFNVYLAKLDRELDAIPGAFYSRYSDDILFAHPSAEVARAASDTIDRVVQELGLGLKQHKRRDLYLTAAGRRSDDWPESRPAMSVPMLGARVSAQGLVSLNRKKFRRLLRDLAARALRTAANTRGDATAKGRLICAAINRALGRQEDPLRPNATDLVRRVVTDRAQLQQLDYWIARIVVRVVSSRDEARVFRDLPYSRLRGEWNLRSLVHARNRWGRGRT